MADYYFEKAESWEALLETHEKWAVDLTIRSSERTDPLHSPAAVLGWVWGTKL